MPTKSLGSAYFAALCREELALGFEPMAPGARTDVVT